MFRSLVTKKLKIIGRLQYSNRNRKTLKFLPPTIKIPIDRKIPPSQRIEGATIQLLEKLSLVGCKVEEGIQVIEDAVRFADPILEADTENVKPLYTVLEDECLLLREDEINNDATTYELLSNCKLHKENYFVTPVGNIEYISEEKPKENSAEGLLSQRA